MGTWTITTDAASMTISAESLDAAAARFASSEGLAARTADALAAEVDALGGWLKIREDDEDGAPTYAIRTINGRGLPTTVDADGYGGKRPIVIALACLATACVQSPQWSACEADADCAEGYVCAGRYCSLPCPGGDVGACSSLVAGVSANAACTPGGGDGRDTFVCVVQCGHELSCPAGTVCTAALRCEPPE